ncbi:MAG: L,D-transpeptidase family protein, partial [Pseudomonadota bacterium]
DPTTGGESLVIDPSLPQPYSADEEALPELPAAPSELTDAVLENATAGEIDLPRGPAARMIQVQNPDLPELPPAPAEITARAMEQAPSVAAPAPALAPAIAQAPKKKPEDPFVINSILPIEGTIRYGEWFWDESRAPAKGKLVVTVDLDARVISVFRDGHEIGTAVALLGTTSHPTPLGTFPILTKEKDNVSEKYDNAPMPWTLRLTWSGIAIHGSPVMNGYASHGCIGVPDPFAEKLFDIAKRGDKVVITRGKMVGVGAKLLS